MGVLPDWGLQIWALTRLAQMVWCSGFLPSIPEEWRAPVEPLESLAGWMPALAPIVPDGNSSWGPMDQLQVMGAANLRNAFPRCALPCLCSDCRGVWPPIGWATPQSLRDSFILQKKSLLWSCRWFPISLSLLCSTKEVGQVRKYVLQILHLGWFFQLILSPAEQ